MDPAYFLVPILETFCARLRFWGPPVSLMRSLWGARVVPSRPLGPAFCLLVCAWPSFGVPLGSSGGPGSSEEDVWGCFPSDLDFQRHLRPTPCPKTSGGQVSNTLRLSYAVGPRFEDSVKHIFEDSSHAKTCEAWLPSVPETC